MAHRK